MASRRRLFSGRIPSNKLGTTTKKAAAILNKVRQTEAGRQALSFVRKKVEAKMGTTGLAFVQSMGNALKDSLPSNIRNISQTTPNATGTSFSSVKVGKYQYLPMKSANYILSQYVNTTSGRLVGTTYGKQVIGTVANTATVESIRNCFRNTSIGGNNTVARDMTIYPKYCKTDLYLTNFDNNNAVVFIYDCVYKHDSSRDLVSELPVSGVNNTSQNPFSTFGTLKDAYFYGTSLLDFTPFTEMAKTVKVTRVELEPGKSHVHTTNQYISKAFQIKNYWSGTSSTLVWDTNIESFAAGITMAQVVVAQSGLVFDSTDSTVTFGTPNIGYASTQSIVIKVPQQATGVTTTYGTQFDSAIAAGAIKFRDQDSQSSTITTDTF